MTAAKRRWSFSLRTMFVVVTVCAVIWIGCFKVPVAAYTRFSNGKNPLGDPRMEFESFPSREPTRTEVAYRAGSCYTILAVTMVLLEIARRAKAA